MSDPIGFQPLPPPSRIPEPPPAPEAEAVVLSVDGREVTVPRGATLLDACRSLGIEVPTLCFLKTLAPLNACRICVVELEGSRALVPSCSRRAEPGMKVSTGSERVRHSRRMVLELLGSSVDLSAAPEVAGMMKRCGADPSRFGQSSRTVAQPVRIDNDLYVRDLSKCILCRRCVEACGAGAQNTYAIAVARRGFDARISAERDAALPDSACVYCGNCVGVCPTGALMSRSEYELRAAGTWDESRQTRTDTVCGYCGVGCALTVHVQDGRIVKIASPPGSPVTRGHLCVKGRFGYGHVQGAS